MYTTEWEKRNQLTTKHTIWAKIQDKFKKTSSLFVLEYAFLSVRLYVRTYVCLYVCMFVCLFVCMYVCMACVYPWSVGV